MIPEIVEKIANEDCKDLMIALLEDGFIKEEDLEYIIYFEKDTFEINMLDFFEDFHAFPYEGKLCISLRLDGFSYNVAKFMETLIHIGIDYYFGGSWIFTESDGLKMDSDLTNEEWIYVNEWKRVKDKNKP